MLFIEKKTGLLNEEKLRPKHRIQSASNVNRVREIMKTNKENQVMLKNLSSFYKD